jgi:hypothetical protein
LQGSSHLADADIAVKTKQSAHCDQNQQGEYKESDCAPLIALQGYIRRAKTLLHDPDTLPNHVKIVESVDAEEAEKKFVVLTSNTIIQEFAVMIELLCAPITSEAMMTSPPYLTITKYAENQLLLPHMLRHLFVKYQSIDRIIDGELDVVIGNDEEEGIVEAQKNPQYLLFDVVKWRHNED